MALVSFIEKRGRRWRFRTRLPASLSTRLGSSFLVASWRTGDTAEAVRRARALKSRVERMTIDVPPTLTPDEARRRVRAFVDAELDAMETEALMRGGLKVLTPEETSALKGDDAAEMEALLASVFLAVGHEKRTSAIRKRLSGFVPAPDPELDAYLDEVRPQLADGAVEAKSPTGVMLDRLALSGRLEVLNRRKALMEGEPAELQPRAPEPQPQPALQPTAAVQNDPYLGNGQKDFLSWWDEYVAAKLSTKDWGQDTAEDAGSTRRIVRELMGGPTLSAMDKRAVSLFRSEYLRLPRKHAQALPWKNMKPRSILAKLDDKDWLKKQEFKPGALKGKTLKSVEKHTRFLQQYWEHLKFHGVISQNALNPFSGFGRSKKSKRETKQARKQWPPELLQTLYRSPVFIGSKSIHRRSEPGPVIFKDAKFWVTLMGPHLGARLNEVCSLNVSDVVWEGDVPMFQIRKTKNEASDRDPPIPPIALKLGFLEYRVYGRKPTEPLFPELIPQGVSQKRSISYGQWFGRYRKAIGVHEEYVDFHSFRASFITAAVNAKVHPVLLDEVTGHANDERRSERDRYTKEVLALNKLEVMRAVDYGVDFSHLVYLGPPGLPASDAADTITTAFERAQKEMDEADKKRRRAEARAARGKVRRKT